MRLILPNDLVLLAQLSNNKAVLVKAKKAIAINSPFPEAERNLAAMPDFSGSITRNFLGTFSTDGATDHYSETSQEK